MPRLTLKTLAGQVRKYEVALQQQHGFVQRSQQFIRASETFAGEVISLRNLRLGERMAQIDTMVAQIGIRIDRMDKILVEWKADQVLKKVKPAKPGGYRRGVRTGAR